MHGQLELVLHNRAGLSCSAKQGRGIKCKLLV